MPASRTATLAVGFGVGLLAVLLGACSAAPTDRPGPASEPGCAHGCAVGRLPVRQSPTRCTAPRPTTAAAYSRMFAALPPDQWAAADVSISVPLPDGRALWLYGDTLATHSFVHSSAVVQDGGCLHVSRAGAQLLPDDDATHIYWIESALAISGQVVEVKARSIKLVGTGPWDFRNGGYERTAAVDVDPSGDVTFRHWNTRVPSPAPDPGPMYRLDGRPHHFGYARHVHPEATLRDGRTLVTTCQNFDDGTLHPFADYRPIFSER